MRGFHWSLLASMSSELFFRRSLAVDQARVVKSIVVVGGTHGNEYTGVFVSKALARSLQRENPYKTFQLSTVIANPEAHLQNKRFIDQDLNRQFSYKALEERDGSEADQPAEARRATELNQLLGPKFAVDADSCASPKTDLSPSQP